VKTHQGNAANGMPEFLDLLIRDFKSSSYYFLSMERML